MQRSGAITVALALLLAAAIVPAASARAPVPGFQVDLAGAASTHLECAVSSGARLLCLNYNRATAPGRCDVGGDVPTVALGRRGKATITHTCVDEGFHDWQRLKAGATFRSGPFRCRTRNARRSLRCWSTVSGWSFSIASDGTVQRARLRA